MSAEVVIDVSFYESQLQVLQADPNTRVVGSLGRMVACQDVLGRPFQEFRDRQMAGINTDRVSDIDVLGTAPDIVLAAQGAGEARVDEMAFRDTDVAIENEDGIWLVRSAETGFEAPLKPELMEPVVGVVAGVEIVTVPLLTHWVLHLLRDPGSQKDRLTEQTLGCLLHTVAKQTGVIPRIDAEAMQSFEQLTNRLLLLDHTAGTDRHSADDDEDDRHSR